MAEQNLPVLKKFYRDMKPEELSAVEDCMRRLRGMYPDYPPHVMKRMVDRGILPNDEANKIFDDEGNLIPERMALYIENLSPVSDAFATGMVFEVSNEGAANPANPYRIVLAKEVGEYVYFVKVSSNPPSGDTIRILDVWRKMGKIPLSPPSHAIPQMTTTWNLLDAFKEG